MKLLVATLFFITLIWTIEVHAQLQLVGKASYKWLWLDIYDAELYHPSGRYDSSSLSGTVLVLSYRTNIKANNLVEQTEKEWRRMGEEWAPERDSWLSELAQIWVNVRKGDSIKMAVNDSIHSEFFIKRASQSKFELMGVVESPNFTSDFLGIWLSDRERFEEERIALLGLNDGERK